MKNIIANIAILVSFSAAPAAAANFEAANFSTINTVSTDDGSSKVLASYAYNSGSISGTMTITDMSACQQNDTLGCMSAARPLKVEIKTINKDTGNDCDLEAIEDTSGRVANAAGMTVQMTIQHQRSDGKPNLSIKFDRSDAIVRPLPAAFGQGCGAGVTYEGQWRLKTE